MLVRQPALLAGTVLFLLAASGGGTLRVAQRAEPKTWNPLTAMDAPSREVLALLHADLIRIDGITQQTAPSLAEHWKRSPDGLRYTVALRKGVRFSNGAPFTADDVVFTWNAYLDPTVRSPQRDLLLLDGQPIRATKRDPHTVEFTLPKPYAAAERLFDSIYILPRHKLEAAAKAGKLSEAWRLDTPPVAMAGLGPFRLREFRPGEAVILERNPYYWARGPRGDALPYLDGVELRLLPDEEVQLARLVSGDLDLVSRLNLKAADFLTRRGVNITDLGPGLEYNFLSFNLTPGSRCLRWFEKREFRAALSRAVDRDAVVKIAYQGRGVPLWGPVSPGNRVWFHHKLPRPPRSLEAARQLLQAAGFRWDTNQKLMDADGNAVTFSILVSSSSAERQQMATLLQADLAALGIAITVAPLEFRSLLDRVLKTRQFDTVLLGLGGSDADPNPEMNVWLSSGSMHLWNPNQKRPATPWEAELDQLMHRQMVELNPATRKRLYDRVQEILAQEQPMVFLASPHIVVAQRGNIGNFQPALFGRHALWNARELFLRPGGAAAR